MNRAHRIGIVPAATRDAVNAALDSFAPNIGPNTFSVPLFAASDDPATERPKHFMCDWSIDNAQWPDIEQICDDFGVVWHEEGDPRTRRARGKGLDRVLRQRGQKVRGVD